MSDQPRLDRLPDGAPPYDFLMVLAAEPPAALVIWAPAVERGWLLSVIGAEWVDRPADLRRVRTQMKESLAVNNGYGHRLIAGAGMAGQRALDFAINGDVGAQGFIAVNPSVNDALLARLDAKIPTAAGRGLRGVLFVDEVARLPGCQALRDRLVKAGASCDLHTTALDLEAALHTLAPRS